MITFTRVLAGAALCAGLGATAAFADATALDKFPGAKEAIMSYYAANAREGGGNCGRRPHGQHRRRPRGQRAAPIRPCSRSTTSSAPRRPAATRAACSGPAMREFTLSKGGSGWSVTGMTGQTP